MVLIFSPKILFDPESRVYDYLPESNVLRNVSKEEFTSLLIRTPDVKGEYSQTLVAGLINQAMALILPKIKLYPRIKTNDSTLQSVIRYCSEHFKESISLDDVAEELHISKFHISHLMSSKLGIGFTEYLNNIRINHACDLLEDTNKKITEIAETSGFGSIRSFNRAFQEIMKSSPTAYRNQFSSKNKN